MANVYFQNYFHIVFSTKRRAPLLHKPWRLEVFKYISKIIKEYDAKPIIVNGVEDHVHILVGMGPNKNQSDLVRIIKNNSSKFINEQKWTASKFAWQSGFGSFTYSHSQLQRVYNYILRQEEHHRRSSFDDEYLKLLEVFHVEFDIKYALD